MSGPPGSAAVAGGSAEAVSAATTTLAAGGSAVDAVLAAAFAAVMSEPVLASLGGGGFLISAGAGEAPTLLDFFVDVPGLGGAMVDAHVQTVVVDFARTGSAASSSTQVFHGGWGTVGVPGCLPGYLEAHACTGGCHSMRSSHRRSRWHAAGCTWQSASGPSCTWSATC